MPMLNNWLKRHQNRTSLLLHIIGIPLTILAIPIAVFHWYITAAVLFVSGYALQFIGHGIEGNDAGEAIIVKKLLKKPYTDIVDKK